MIKKNTSKKTSKVSEKRIGKKIVMSKFVKPVVWTLGMSVGEKTIDEQHKKLLSQLNDLIVISSKTLSREVLMSVRKTLHFFENYYKEHFSYEEKYLQDNDYPLKSFQAHKKLHTQFINFFNKLNKEFENIYFSKKEFMRLDLNKILVKSERFLADWLINHILREDHKYALFIKKNKEKKLKSE